MFPSTSPAGICSPQLIDSLCSGERPRRKLTTLAFHGPTLTGDRTMKTARNRPDTSSSNRAAACVSPSRRRHLSLGKLLVAASICRRQLVRSYRQRGGAERPGDAVPSASLGIGGILGEGEGACESGLADGDATTGHLTVACTSASEERAHVAIPPSSTRLPARRQTRTATYVRRTGPRPRDEWIDRSNDPTTCEPCLFWNRTRAAP